MARGALGSPRLVARWVSQPWLGGAKPAQRLPANVASETPPDLNVRRPPRNAGVLVRLNRRRLKGLS